MRALVNCETNTGWSDWSWSTETPYPGLLSVSFLLDHDFLPFVTHCLLLVVPSMYYAQRDTSYFNYINIDGRNPSSASLNMDLGWRWDKLSRQDLNSCCKGDITSGNTMMSICYCVRLFDSFILPSEEIGMYPIFGTFLDLSNWLTTIKQFLSRT